MDIWNTLEADTYREYGRFTLWTLIKGTVTHRTFRVVVIIRLCQNAATSQSLLRIMLPIFQVLHRIATHSAAIDLSWRTEIGAGVALIHGWGLVINERVKIGKNVTLLHGVTLGQRDKISHEGKRLTEYPIIEDEVWIGPHAIIVGGITIGKGSRIAGGAFVTDSIPPHSIVLGNPSTIVQSNCIPDVINPAPI